MWEKLLELGQPLSMPWLILGDFNCVKPPAEKKLGATPTCTPQFNFCRKLKALKGSLNAFNNLHFSHIYVRAKEANLALQDAQLQLESNPENTAIQDSLGILGRRSSSLLKQKGSFTTKRDRNTKFFHDMVKRNAVRSSIFAVTKSDDSIVMSVADIGQEFIAYYTSLLGTEVQTLPMDNDVFEWRPKLSSKHALELCRTVTPSEVKQAIFQVSDNKAPGSNGYSACFFKSVWNVIDFFRSGRMLRQLNHAIIAFLPKSEHSPSVADYRVNSCCNVIYKVITKIITDWLAATLEHLIDRCQSAFVGGENIINNIFLAQEMVRQYTRKWISPCCTINVDLRKAFDSV
ncbi:UNVERIFIED_CONTAM: hypothetical protein Slati_4276900 [Sesamum latifolium]|uniref:Reverse transcriptase n=1 Tax=Sesamum latifolium TaxID=2727402 RepID=A0AAW2TCI2_9LAMI